MPIKCSIVPVTPYQQNCSVIRCEATGKGAIVDPGGDIERILETGKGMDATIEKIILTHAHMDHCAAADVLRKQLRVPIEGPHRDDEFWLQGLPQACAMSGFPHADAFLPDRWLQQGDTVSVGEQVLDVLHCPGHTPGHVASRGTALPLPSDRSAAVILSWPMRVMADSADEREARLRSEYHAQTARIRWHELQTHFAGGRVVVVAPGTDLVEVAVQLGMDNTDAFTAWIADGQVSGVSEEQALAWYAADADVWAVVAAPWVLVQPLPSESP